MAELRSLSEIDPTLTIKALRLTASPEEFVRYSQERGGKTT